MTHDWSPAQPFQNPHLNLLRPHRQQPIEPPPKARHILPRQPHDQIRVDMHPRLRAQEPQVILQLRQILPPANVPRSRLVERLNPHLKLQRARRKFRDHLAQRIWKAIRHHLEMHEQPFLPARQEKFQDRPARREIQIECAIDKFELHRPPRQQALQCRQKRLQRKRPHRHLQRRQAELARKRTPARCLHIKHPMREIRLRIQIVRQPQLLRQRQRRRDHLR